jgi:hypothetical protein
MRRAAWLLLAPLVLAGPLGCGGRKPAPEAVEPQAEPVSVELKNEFALPVELFAEGSGASFRLGVVHPGMTGRFTVPLNVTIGGSTEFILTTNSQAVAPWRSGPMLLAPGSIVDVVAANKFFASTAVIRP